jgi:hypothetical protein
MLLDVHGHAAKMITHCAEGIRRSAILPLDDSAHNTAYLCDRHTKSVGPLSAFAG